MITYRLALVVLSLAIQVRPRVLDEQLRLQAEIESQRYCAIDDDTSTLLIRFKLRLLNHGTSPIVIGRPIYPLLLVSRTLPALQKGDHEFVLHPPDVFGVIEDAGTLEHSTPGAPPEQFVSREGETLETSTLETTVPKRETGGHERQTWHRDRTMCRLFCKGRLRARRPSFVQHLSPVKITVQKMPRLENRR